MNVVIQQIACQTPQTAFSQDYVLQQMLRRLDASRQTQRYIKRIYRNCGIDKRHSVIEDPDWFFAADKNAPVTTKERNALFARHAGKMSVALARQVIHHCNNHTAAEITHLITVSCTGFYNPGMDFDIIQALNLHKNVQRYHIGFMGCYAAFPALRLAKTVCLADPNATVLIVAVELCTLHLQVKPNLDAILGGATFADGGGAVLVSTKKPQPAQSVFELQQFESALIQDSAADMAWTIGNEGFEMVLSQYVPKIIEMNLGDFLHPLLKRWDMPLEEVDHWALHPGGKSILDKIQRCLQIHSGLSASRHVLRQFGNMSSATILFVLKAILEDTSADHDQSIIAMAFGPGLTVEAGLLRKSLTLPQTHATFPTNNQASRATAHANNF